MMMTVALVEKMKGAVGGQGETRTCIPHRVSLALSWNLHTVPEFC